MTVIEAIELALETLEVILRGERLDQVKLRQQFLLLQAAKESARRKEDQDELDRSAIRSLAARRRLAAKSRST
jgi:hypothetical protein